MARLLPSLSQSSYTGVMRQVYRKRRRPKFVIGLLCLAVAGWSAYAYNQPLPALQATPGKPDVLAASNNQTTTNSVQWPAFGQAAIGAVGYGPLVSHGQQTPAPTASVAKLMTALVVLDKKPLAAGQTGPALTITEADQTIYDWYYSRDGSLAAIQVGQQLSQYDALEAVLLPSANNMSDKLAIWAFGSIEAYRDYANKYAQQHGMRHTTIDDASGFSPYTISTAEDLVRLASLALQNPVIAEIVAKRQAEIPVAGVIYNTNGLLGRNGINGVKTGSTDQAGGVFVASAERELSGGQKATVIAAVMGGPDLVQAMLASLPLLDAAAANIKPLTVASKGQVFGSYTAPWSDQKIEAVAQRDASLLVWPGSNLPTAKITLTPLSGTPEKTSASGSVSFTSGDQQRIVELALSHDVQPPTVWQRLMPR